MQLSVQYHIFQLGYGGEKILQAHVTSYTILGRLMQGHMLSSIPNRKGKMLSGEQETLMAHVTLHAKVSRDFMHHT